jgi:hypothetical protein
MTVAAAHPEVRSASAELEERAKEIRFQPGIAAES